MYIKKFIYRILFIFIPFFLFSIEKYVDIDLIKKAGPPRFLDKGVLFTLDENYGYSIYLRTDIDDWKQNHYFKKNLYGVWKLILPYDYSKNKFCYKLNVDGFWENDPNNDKYTEDKYGASLSVLKIPEEVYYIQNNPVVEISDSHIKKVKFKYYNPAAKDVNFITSQDNWSQFTNSMTLNDDGYWEISINFKKGIWYYYFLVDGKKVVDIENPEKKVLRDIKEVSVVNIH